MHCLGRDGGNSIGPHGSPSRHGLPVGASLHAGGVLGARGAARGRTPRAHRGGAVRGSATDRSAQHRHRQLEPDLQPVPRCPPRRRPALRAPRRRLAARLADLARARPVPGDGGAAANDGCGSPRHGGPRGRSALRRVRHLRSDRESGHVRGPRRARAVARRPRAAGDRAARPRGGQVAGRRRARRVRGVRGRGLPRPDRRSRGHLRARLDPVEGRAQGLASPPRRVSHRKPMSPLRQSPYLVGIDEALAEIRAGRMVILMDDEDRENEGDLCVAAERVTAEHVNFMATHGRGLICLSLTEERCEQLGLPMMVSENRAPLGTAFTVSIDARQGITRGISAVDRATTIRTAIRADATPADLVTPGHVFPLRARRGGVLVRAGQTEGAVDLARLAGFVPGGVICEILREDGTMARLADLEAFAARHGLKITTIADLIEYRSRHDSLVHRRAEARITTRHGGDFRALVYTTDVDEAEHLVLVKGDIRPDEPVLARPHLEYLPGDVFAYRERDTRSLLQKAMERIAAEGKGVILYLRRDGRSLDLFSEARADTVRAPSTALGSSWLANFREFGIGAQILRDEIGRASCRERVESTVVDGSLKKKGGQ